MESEVLEFLGLPEEGEIFMGEVEPIFQRLQFFVELCKIFFELLEAFFFLVFVVEGVDVGEPVEEVGVFDGGEDFGYIGPDIRHNEYSLMILGGLGLWYKLYFPWTHYIRRTK